MTIHHIGYAVKSIPDSLAAFTALGFVALGEEIADTERNISILF